MCFSDATPAGGSSQKKYIYMYIYITLLQGGREKTHIYIYYVFFARPPPTPCEKKMRRMWPMGTRSMPMPSLKKWNTWGQVQGTPGGEVQGTPGGEVGIHKGDK